MATSQPASSDYLNSPDHSLMHRQIAADTSAAVKSIEVYSNGTYKPNNLKFGIKAVSGYGTNVTITFSTDEKTSATPAQFPESFVIAPIVTPDWATSFYVSAISVTGFTVNFGTGASSGGGNVYWIALGLL